MPSTIKTKSNLRRRETAHEIAQALAGEALGTRKALEESFTSRL